MKVDHIAIWVKDLEKTRIFYEKYFKAKSNQLYINNKKKFSSYFLTFSGKTRLEIMQMPSVLDSLDDLYSQHIGYIHIAISVGSKDEVINLTKRLADDGYEILDNPRYSGDGYFESIIMDPENNRIEITI